MGPIPEKASLKCAEPGSSLVYHPLKSFDELINYGENPESSKSLTETVGEKLSLDIPQEASVPCSAKTIPLNTNFSSVKMTLDGRRLNESICPKTLVCHDFKGGYGDDKFVDGTANPENFIFRHWLQTDIFVYFSHFFITIPPLGWINSAHMHGVKVLGTIITEWDDGIKLCDEILKDSESIHRVVKKLCQVAKNYGFEGYLINIENELKERDIPYMLEFVETLTKSLKQLSENNMVIWYDSVTTEGKLKWQDCLNQNNKPFFDACDGIYLNYGWNDEKLKHSVETAGDRKLDVYVGVDVFGRGCFGGGGIKTYQAIEKIAPYELSLAIFAPGWSFECNPYDSFPKFDDELWISCSNFLTFRCLKDVFHQITNFNDILSPTSNSPNKKFKVHFSTDFSRGYGTKTFSFGKEPLDKSWFNLSQQTFQPYLNLAPLSENNIVYDTTDGFSGGGSLRINNSKHRSNYQNPLTSPPIWFPLDIPITSNRLSIAVLAAWKSAFDQTCLDKIHIYLEVAQPGNKSKKILLGSTDHLATSVLGKFYIHLKLSHFLQAVPVYEEQGKFSIDKEKDLDFFFRKNNYDEKKMDGWLISCFLFDIDQGNNQYCGINSLKVAAEGDISLGFLSLAQITHYDEKD